MARTPLSRQAILVAAANLADRDGFDAIVVSAVARQLGVRTASLYFHIRDRAALLAGVQELAMGELADVISAEIAGRSGRDALTALGVAQRTYAKASPGRAGGSRCSVGSSPASSRPSRRPASPP